MLDALRTRIALFFWGIGDLFDPTPPSVEELDWRTALRPGETLGEYVDRLNDGRVG